MKMSGGVEWSVHCLSLLASLPPDRTLSAKRLAEFHGIPAAYLTKHLQALVRDNILESIPGPRGGFRLSRATEQITLLDVVDAIDGKRPAFRCSEIRQRGPSALGSKCYRRPCGIAAAFANADAAWRGSLMNCTLSDLIAEIPEKVDPRQQKKSAAWLKKVLG